MQALISVVVGLILVGVVLFLIGASTVGPIIFALVKGSKALKRSRQVSDPEQATILRYLALNQIEPSVNLWLLVFLASIRPLAAELELYSPIPMAVLITLPMAVLLLPFLGLLQLKKADYRRICWQLGFNGIARWLLTAIIFTMTPFSFIAFIVGAMVLWITSIWCSGLLRSSFPVSPTSNKPGYNKPMSQQPAASASRLQAARATATPAVVPVQSPPTIPLVTPPPAPAYDNHPILLCPVCTTPAAISAVDCTGCGLLFSSRVPSVLQQLPDYEVLRPLGDGGMSSVYLACKRFSRDLVVLKTLASVDGHSQHDIQWRAEAARCLRQEADLLQQLTHPNIARMRSWYSGAHIDLLVLDYIPGLTLEQRLTRHDGQGSLRQGRALPPAEAIGYAITVAEILEYLAALPQPVVHHDIKPANLIVHAEHGQLVLVDFGSALPPTGEIPTDLGSYGTPGYAAPEQYKGTATPASDIYGLGATLYHLLTDDCPSDHPLRFPQLDRLAPELVALLQPTLAVHPQQRPTARQVRAQLQRLQRWFAG